MSDKNDHPLDRLVETVRTSRNYKSVSEAFIRSIGTRELARSGSLKEAARATRNKLHQVGGAYLGNQAPHYSLWLDELKAAVRSGDREQLLSTCAKIMGHHASTRERLPILDQFYASIFAALPPVHTILDIACGF